MAQATDNSEFVQHARCPVSTLRGRAKVLVKALALPSMGMGALAFGSTFWDIFLSHLGLRWSSLRRCLSCLRAGMGWESLGAEAEGACCIPGALRARKPGAAAASLPHPSLHPLPQPSVPTTTTTIALPAQGSTKLPADPLRSASWRSGQNQQIERAHV